MMACGGRSYYRAPTNWSCGAHSTGIHPLDGDPQIRGSLCRFWSKRHHLAYRGSLLLWQGMSAILTHHPDHSVKTLNDQQLDRHFPILDLETLCMPPQACMRPTRGQVDLTAWDWDLSCGRSGGWEDRSGRAHCQPVHLSAGQDFPGPRLRPGLRWARALSRHALHHGPCRRSLRESSVMLQTGNTSTQSN